MAMRTKDPKMSCITVQTPKQRAMTRTRMTLISTKSAHPQRQSADKAETRRGNRTMVDTVRGGRSRLSCLGLGLVSERALSRLLGG